MANASDKFGGGGGGGGVLLGQRVVLNYSEYSSASPTLVTEDGKNYLRHGVFTFDQELYSPDYITSVGPDLIQEDNSSEGLIDPPPNPFTLYKIGNRYKELNGVFYTTSNSLVYRSLDKGITWEEIYNFPNGNIFYFYAVQPDALQNANALIITNATGSARNFAISHDGGATWSTGTFSSYQANVTNITSAGLYVDETKGYVYSLNQSSVGRLFLTILGADLTTRGTTIELPEPAATLAQTSISNDSSFLAAATDGLFMFLFRIGTVVTFYATSHAGFGTTTSTLSLTGRNIRVNTTRYSVHKEGSVLKVIFGTVTSSTSNAFLTRIEFDYDENEDVFLSQGQSSSNPLALMPQPRAELIGGSPYIFQIGASEAAGNPNVSSVVSRFEPNVHGDVYLNPSVRNILAGYGAVYDPDDKNKLITFGPGTRFVYEFKPVAGSTFSNTTYPFSNTYIRIK